VHGAPLIAPSTPRTKGSQDTAIVSARVANRPMTAQLGWARNQKARQSERMSRGF